MAGNMEIEFRGASQKPIGAGDRIDHRNGGFIGVKLDGMFLWAGCWGARAPTRRQMQRNGHRMGRRFSRGGCCGLSLHGTLRALKKKFRILIMRIEKGRPPGAHPSKGVANQKSLLKLISRRFTTQREITDGLALQSPGETRPSRIQSRQDEKSSAPAPPLDEEGGWGQAALAVVIFLEAIRAKRTTGGAQGLGMRWLAQARKKNWTGSASPASGFCFGGTTALELGN